MEDNPVDVDLVALAFARSQNPPEILLFESAEDALADMTELENADVIAIDPGLPGMSGQSLARELRARDLGPVLLLAMSEMHAQSLVENEDCDGATVKTLTAETVFGFLAAHRAGLTPLVVQGDQVL